MATSQKLTQHFLTCPVCLEVFTNPCTLACGHSFCVQCVVNYTKNRPDAVIAKALPCSFCKQLSKVPDPSRPVEEWIGQFKPSLLLVGLLDTIGPGSKDTSNCNLCSEGGMTMPATTWCSVCDISLCERCLKAHGRIPASRHHIVPQLSGEIQVKGKQSDMCQEHRKECITLYCKECRTTLCESCRVVYHRYCKSVQSLESLLPEMRNVLEAKQETLRENIHSRQKQINSLKLQCSDMQQIKSSIQSQIISTAQKAMDAITKKEKQLMDELDEITDEQMNQLKSDIGTGDMEIQIYKQQLDLIKHALKSEVDMYDLYQSCVSGNVESVDDTDIKERRTRTRIEFSQDIDKMHKALEELPLGEIQVIHEGVLDAVSTPVLSHTIDCTTKEDNKDPGIYDIACMAVEQEHVLLVTDFDNKCVKSFFTRNHQQCHSRLGLQSGPRRIAKLEDNKVAITLPDTSQIVTVKVTPELSLLSSTRTRKKYHGLTALTPTTVAAGSRYPPCVDILDNSGNLLQSLSPLMDGQKLINYPLFLCTMRTGNILVSDKGSSSLLCMTPQGEVVFTYQLRSLRGVTVTRTGDILVADYCGHNVVRLSESGQLVRDILTQSDGIKYPYCVYYDERGCLYVTHEDVIVKVYKFN